MVSDYDAVEKWWRVRWTDNMESDESLEEMEELKTEYAKSAGNTRGSGLRGVLVYGKCASHQCCCSLRR